MLQNINHNNVLHYGTDTLVVLDQRDEYSKPVCLKVLNDEYPGTRLLRKIENEFEFSHQENCPPIRKALKRIKIENHDAILFDFIEGTDLKKLQFAEKLSFTDKLKLALDLSRGISEMHSHHIIHNNLNPSNILVEHITKRIYLIDFALASNVSTFTDLSERLSSKDLSFYYISPEQTGRINRQVDNRSDLYSLGVILYELFTGTLPFGNRDPLEHIFSLIAKTPTPPVQLAVETGTQLSSIICRLLAKNAEDRYQSAFGLEADLSRCYKSYTESGTIESFDLGGKDFSGKLIFNQKLIGRDTEIKEMLRVFEKSIIENRQLLMVSGYAGSGKTTLVAELHKPVIERNGYYISGKFDQFLRDQPYSGFIQAFADVIQFLLTVENAKLVEWKNNILAAVAPLGKILTDLIPNLVKLIGEQPPVPELNGVEAQNRFHYVFGKFIRSITFAQHPLVIFIDDLQWADESSFNLVRYIMNDADLKRLLIICSFRSNEIDKGHPIKKMLDDFDGNAIHYSTIDLQDLNEEQVDVLVKEELQTGFSDNEELISIIFQKTKGNPFYIHQFMKSIYEEGLLFFNFKTGNWNWNTQKIKDLNISGNVVDLMTGLVEKLPAETIELLKTASCIGNKFDLRTISLLQQLHEDETENLLQKPLLEGLIIPSLGTYRFAHDRIQQAIYSLISEEKRKDLHLRLGKAMSGITNEFELPERIFEITNQWNLGVELIPDQKTKTYVSNLNKLAGRKAMSSSAHRQSFQYFEKATSLLTPDIWQLQYQETLELYNDTAEASYLCGEYERTDELVNDILAHAKSNTDRVSAFEVAIQKLIAQNKLPEAISYGVDKLQLFGIRLPAKAGKMDILRGLIKTRLLLGNKPASSIYGLPEMKDPEKLAAMRLLAEIGAPAYFASPLLLPILAFTGLRLSVKYGLSINSPFSFYVYGFIQTAYLGNVDKGIEFGRISLDLVSRLKADKLRASALMTHNVMLVHWKVFLPETLPDLEDGFRAGLETGDYEYSSYLAHNIIYHSFYGGIHLEELLQKASYLEKQIAPFRQELTIKRLRLFVQSIANLVTETSNPFDLKGEFFDESLVELSQESRNDIYYQNLYLQKAVLAYIFNNPKQAFEFITLASRYHESVQGSALYPLFYYYQSLIIASIYKQLPGIENTALLKTMIKNLKLLKKYEQLSTKNYHQKRLLVEAELRKLQGKKEEARELFDLAIKKAAENNMLQDEVLCWERRAVFCAEEGEDQLARFYYLNAAKKYHQWGAGAKVKQLLAQHDLAKSSTDEAWLATGPEKVKQSQLSNLDLGTVLKASIALSGEIILSRLLKILMQIITENAGAQQGFFIMEKKGNFYIEAEIESDREEIITQQSMPVHNCGRLAESIINYVHLTRENVILDNATNSQLFANDEYIKKHQPKSILCVPFINQGKLQGIIYLSNDLTAGVFTENRIELLRLLAGQIAVSIENALFYEELENRVEERTNELQVEKKKSEDLLLNILPEDIAFELKQTGRSVPRSFEHVAVLFTDFKDFTSTSEKLSPEELVNEIDYCFRKFDEIISRYNLEKIKTIGDAYLCVSGLPNTDDYSIEGTIRAAIEILDFVKQEQAKRLAENKLFFCIRIGIHVGPVVAGIVGNKKFAYDIWGDTVNTAARMEQSCEPDQINISNDAYQLIKSKFNCRYRGKISAKNKGEIDMYYVEEEI